MIQLFKIIHEYEEVNLCNLSVIDSSTTRGHNYKLQKTHMSSRQSQNRFTNRVVNAWNSLPYEAVNAKSVNSFKSEINTAWKMKDCKFNSDS